MIDMYSGKVKFIFMSLTDHLSIGVEIGLSSWNRFDHSSSFRIEIFEVRWGFGVLGFWGFEKMLKNG